MTSTQERPTPCAEVASARPASFRVIAGLLSGTAALVAGELAGRLVPGGASPVISVSNRAVELTPDSPRQAGISTFGTLDKPLLLGGILLVVALLSWRIGVLAARRPGLAEGVVAALVVVVVLAVVFDNGATFLGALLTGVAVLFVGVAVLRFLSRPGPAATHGCPDPDPDPDPDPGHDRRHFLKRTAVVGFATISAGSVLRALDARAEVGAVRAALGLRQPLRRATGDVAAAELGIPGLTPVVTPNSVFYRIDTALVVPQIDPRGYSISVGGMVERPLRLTYEQLLDLPQVEADVTIACVSNEVGGDLVGLARWQGVLLRDVLEMAGVQRGADQIVGESVDGFTAGFPTSYGLDARDAMVAVGMNGEPLPVIHGFPARLIVPGLYGYVSATKWLKSITLTTLDAVDGFWIPRGWSKLGPIKIASRIDVPRSGARLAEGPVTVGGMAWAPGLDRGVEAVEVRVDEGPWQQADLGGELSESSWRQWVWTWPATPGRHVIEVRATDRTGEVQTERQAAVAPDGASGYHAVGIEIA